LQSHCSAFGARTPFANPVRYYAPVQDFVVGGSTLVLAHITRTVPEIRDDQLDDDVIYELDGSGALKDTVWTGADHISEFGFDAAALSDIRTRDPGTTLEWLHGNSMSLVGPEPLVRRRARGVRSEQHHLFEPQRELRRDHLARDETSRVAHRTGFRGPPRGTPRTICGPAQSAHHPSWAARRRQYARIRRRRRIRLRRRRRF
jgi:hypothetical protein